MKFFYFFLFVFFIIITTSYSADPVLNQSSIFDIIKSTKGNIFTQMRNMKTLLPKDVHNEVEKSVKQYESLYLSNQEDFVDFIWDKYREMKYTEEIHNVDHIDEILHHEVNEFGKEFIKHYKKFNPEEKSKIDTVLEKEDEYIKNIIHHIKANGHVYDEDKFGSLHSIIETLPSLLIKTHNVDGESYKAQKINKDFKNFIDEIHNEYNLHEINKVETLPLHLKKNKINEIVNSIKPKHKEWFSSFFEEYMHEAVINNDDFKKFYTMDKMKELDLSKIKRDSNIANTQYNSLKKPAQKGSFRFKNINRQPSDPESRPIENEPDEPEVQKEGKELETYGTALKIVGAVKEIKEQQRKEEAESDKTDLSGDCGQRVEKLQGEIEKKSLKLNLKFDKVDLALFEVPKFMIPKINLPDNIFVEIAIDMITKFIEKLVVLLVKHIPFYFFKICLPPGPLVFGCCPEAAFFPQQLYGIFTAFEKVDKMKLIFKGFNDWISALNHDPELKEDEQLICAQLFFSIHESSLFNFCNPLTLNMAPPFLMLNTMGQLPGDLPLCWFSCIPAMLLCKASLSDITPCEATISLSAIIGSILSMPLRIRLGMSFSPLCTFVPFLVRWDLLPDLNFDIVKETKGTEGANCAAKEEPPRQEVPSAMEKELCELDPDCMKEIERIKSQIVETKELPEYERGAPVKKTTDDIRHIDIDKDFKLGKKIAEFDTNVDVFSRTFTSKSEREQAVYHILNYAKESSKEREQDFPFHTKRMVIDD